MDSNVMEVSRSDTRKQVTNKLAKKIHTQWEYYRSERSQWEKEIAECEDFFIGRHYSAQEIVDMKLNGMQPTIVERIRPIILQEVAIFTSNRPRFQALPRDDADPAIANLWSDVLTWIWQYNDGDSKYQQCITSYFVKGAGYMFVGVDPYEDDGNGEVVLEYLPAWDVYPDPLARKIDLSDARSIKVSRMIPRSTLRFNFPDQFRKVNKAESDVGSVIDKPFTNPMPEDGSGGYGFSQNDISFVDEDDELVRVIEDYEKIRIPFWKVADARYGTVEIFKPEDWKPEFKTATQVYQKIWRTRVRVTAVLGTGVVLYRAVLPTDTYPVIPFFLHHNDSPWVQGDVSILKENQRTVNKVHSIMLHNASQMSNFRWLAQRGSIHAKGQWEETGSRSGTILEYNQGYEKPEPVMPGQLPAGWFQLEGLSKESMEYSVGVFSHMMGSNAEAPDTYRGLLALEEAGQRKIKFKIQHANHALRRLGRVMMDYARALYRLPKVMRIAGESQSEYKEIYLNQMGIDPITKKPKMFNDISIGKYDIVIYDGTSMPTNRMALLQLYMELFQIGVVDEVEVLKKTDVPNRDEVLERVGQAQRLTSEVKQLQESLEDIQALNQTLRRQLQQSMVKNEALDASMAIKGELMETQGQQKLLRLRMSDEMKLFNKELQLEKAKIKAQGTASAAMFKARELVAVNAAKNKGANNGT